MNFGIDRLLEDRTLQKRLKGRRLALVAHPASVTKHLAHSMDALFASGLALAAAFGPQHGLRGDKQDNMIGEHYGDHRGARQARFSSTAATR